MYIRGCVDHDASALNTSKRGPLLCATSKLLVQVYAAFGLWILTNKRHHITILMRIELFLSKPAKHSQNVFITSPNFIKEQWMCGKFSRSGWQLLGNHHYCSTKRPAPSDCHLPATFRGCTRNNPHVDKFSARMDFIDKNDRPALCPFPVRALQFAQWQ